MTTLPDLLRIEITEAEILADLTWPGPPPGEWTIPPRTARRAPAPAIPYRGR